MSTSTNTTATAAAAAVANSMGGGTAKLKQNKPEKIKFRVSFPRNLRHKRCSNATTM